MWKGLVETIGSHKPNRDQSFKQILIYQKFQYIDFNSLSDHTTGPYLSHLFSASSNSHGGYDMDTTMQILKNQNEYW